MPSVAVAGFYPGVRLNNGLDDDCDGKVDEEIPNGIGEYVPITAVIMDLVTSLTPGQQARRSMIFSIARQRKKTFDFLNFQVN